MLCNDGANIVNNPRSVHVGCEVEKVAVGEVILRMIHFFPLSVLLHQLSILILSSPFIDADKSKTIPIQAWTGPKGFRKLRRPEFLDNWHVKVVRFLALRTGCLYPRAIMRKGGLRQWKIQWLHQESNRLSHCRGHGPLKDQSLSAMFLH